MKSVLFFSILCATCIIQAMDTLNNCTSFKTKDKKIIKLTKQEKDHSSYLSNPYMEQVSKRAKPPYIEIDVTSHDMILFKKIIHQPALYDTFSNKKYCKALTVAERLQAPLLYAELLNARLPQQAINLITQKYIYLQRMPCTQQDIVNMNQYLLYEGELQQAYFLSERRAIEKTYRMQSTTFKAKLTMLITTSTLPQVVLLSLIRVAYPSYYQKTLEIIPHMPGYSAFTNDWTAEQQEFLLTILPIEIRLATTRTKKEVIASIAFTVENYL